MTTLSYASATQNAQGWLNKSENWLDAKGRGAWIAVMVLGFVLAWPVGLAILAYLIWSKRMFSKSCRGTVQHRWSSGVNRATGNQAFDSYKADTLRRLEDEQAQFESFLERLREAKDKAEFDQFMDDRARKAAQSTAE